MGLTNIQGLLVVGVKLADGVRVVHNIKLKGNLISLQGGVRQHIQVAMLSAGVRGTKAHDVLGKGMAIWTLPWKGQVPEHPLRPYIL